jgi:hypothetical protein
VKVPKMPKVPKVKSACHESTKKRKRKRECGVWLVRVWVFGKYGSGKCCTVQGAALASPSLR